MSPPMGMPRVLFVDDDEALGRSFERSARAWGFDVVTTVSPLEAIRLAREVSLSVVVTDLRMPALSGLELIQQLRIEHKELTFLLVTGVPDLDRRRLGAADPAVVATLAKPWNDDELRDAIARGVEISAHRRQGVPSKGPDRALLVEDCPADAELVQTYLRKAGWRVDLVTRLRDAEQALSDKSYEAVLVDLSLPDGHGLDCVMQLRHTVGDAALVVVSGLDDEVVARQAIRAGAHDYLVKGIDRSALVRALVLAQERGEYTRRLGRLARYDALTGLPNRATMREALACAQARARALGCCCGLLYVDLDRFKRINDSLGHEAGDVLLREVAGRLKGAVREGDTVARLGGDEFAVVLAELDEPSEAEAVGHRIVRVMEAPVDLPQASVVVTCSVGFAVADRGAPLCIDDLLHRADRSMYEAKRSGRNRLGHDVPHEEEEGSARISLENELRRAVERGGLSLAFQPQFQARSGALVGYEALLRWTRADGTRVSPSVFVPILEDLGLIDRAGRWVIEQACRAMAAWRARGLPPEVRMAVNVSGQQFEDPSFVAAVEAALGRVRLPPEAMDLEITETVLMRDTDATTRTLEELRELGARIAIDDFGTGYSSLSYLQRFAVGALKIDQSFMPDLEQRSAESIAAAVIDIGRRLDIEVVAEGVETPTQHRELRDLGCGVIQGFLLGRPGPGWQPHTAA